MSDPVEMGPAPDDTHTWDGEQWVKNLEIVKARNRSWYITICSLAKAVALELDAIRAGEVRPKEVDDFLTMVKESVECI